MSRCTQALANISKDTEHVVLQTKTFSKHTLLVALINSITNIKPAYFTQASKDPAWRVAMASEFDVLIRNGTWNLVLRNPSMNVIACKYFFRLKHHVDGTIEIYKACLVTKSYQQMSGIDFTKTFMLVIKNHNYLSTTSHYN